MSEKVFEDYFSEIQSDMVSLALDYVGGKADKIYVYGSNDGGVLFFDVFYNIERNILGRSELDKVDSSYDTSTNRQIEMLQIGVNDLKRLKKLFEGRSDTMPTEMKLYYDVKSGNFNAEYKYDPIHSNSEELTPKMVFVEWFEEIKKTMTP